MKRLPYSTLSLAALAVVIHFVPALGNLLQFDRTAVAHGQVWRFFTAHLTHFGDDHLRWDLLAFVVLGAIAERISRKGFALACACSAVAITLGVWIAQPQFTTYRGLSGIDSALFGFVIATVLVEGFREHHAFSIVTGALALGGFGAKCLFEILTGGTVFVDAADAFAPVPLAHLVGLAAGAGVQLARARLSMLDNCVVPMDSSVPSSVTGSTRGA